jgi:RHS repeat-associated protein
VTTRFLWEGFRLLQEIHDDVPLTYVYSDAESYEPLARIDGTEDPDIFWFHCQPNGTPERMTDREGHIRWEGQNSAWGKLLHESIPQETGYAQNLRMQGQYLDRETGLHYNLFRYYDPDSARFTQQDPIGLAGINLYQYAPNALSWIDPLGLKCGLAKQGEDLYVGTYGQVRGGNLRSGLNPTHTPHHAIQNAASPTTHSRGITINLRKDLHELTWTFKSLWFLG